MRKNFIIGGITACSLSLLAGAALAQQGRGVPADVNGDGRVSQAEFVDGRIARLTALDADRDGSVSADEARTGVQARRAERIAARFDRLDADRNGSLTRAEFEAAQSQWAERAPARAGKRGQRMGGRLEARGPVAIDQLRARATEAFTRLDSNRDGFVTPQEQQAARETMRGQRQARRTQRGSQAAPTTE